MIDERRSLPRYPAVRYSVWVKRRSLLGKYRTFRVASVRDLNRNGVSFVSAQRLCENDTLILKIRSGSECVSGILARVRHVRRRGNEYCTGVEFQQSQPPTHDSQSAGMDVLQCIESLVRSRV